MAKNIGRSLIKVLEGLKKRNTSSTNMAEKQTLVVFIRHGTERKMITCGDGAAMTCFEKKSKGYEEMF